MEKIVKYPNDLLKNKCDHVDDINSKEIKYIISLLKEELEKLKESAVGIAANQVGFSKAIFIAKIPIDGNQINIFINPIITYKSIYNKNKSREGCLSKNGYYPKIERYYKIWLEWTTETGEKKQRQFTGMESRIIQHEYDHLNGKCIADNLVG